MKFLIFVFFNFCLAASAMGTEIQCVAGEHKVTVLAGEMSGNSALVKVENDGDVETSSDFELIYQEAPVEAWILEKAHELETHVIAVVGLSATEAVADMSFEIGEDMGRLKFSGAPCTLSL